MARKRIRRLVVRPLVRRWRHVGRLRKHVGTTRRRRETFRRETFGRYARHRLHRAGVSASLRAFQAARPPDAFAPDYRDLWSLYSVARERRPTTVLEFGSGCSTVVLAQALRDNGGGHIWSLDNGERWAATNEAAIPDELRPLVDIAYSPVVLVPRGGQFGVGYATIPDVYPDLVYVDGPGVSIEQRPAEFVARSASGLSLDVLDIEERLRPGCLIIIDGRTKSVDHLNGHLTRPHTFRRVYVGWHFIEIIAA